MVLTNPQETGHGITDKWMEQWGFFVPETPS